MRQTKNDYQEYTKLAIEEYSRRSGEERNLLVNSVGERPVARVLDIGCGVGQEMAAFAKKKSSFCIGIDIGSELGRVGPAFVKEAECQDAVRFVRSLGEELPFADHSFELVLCRVALPYMDNKRTIAEISRVLSSDGIFLLKTHAPAFYFGMIKSGVASMSLRKTAYPLICLFVGGWHALTGIQLRRGFWSGKEVYQTKRLLEKMLNDFGMRIESELPDSDRRAPSYFIVKVK